MTSTVQSKLITPQRAHDIAYGNLLQIFAERDSSKRQTIIQSTYSPEAVIYEPGAVSLQGHTAIDKQVSKILAEKDGWDFIPMSPVRLNHDFVHLAWGFGPRSSGKLGSGDKEGVDVKGTGSDNILVDPESGKIKALYVVINGPSDVKL